MGLSVDIEKKLGSFTLSVQFETDGGVMALLGASGSGKSMTLKCIAGIERPDKGRIVLNGKTLFDSERRICLSVQKRRVGYLFQQYALFPHMTVEENVRCGLPKGAPMEEVPQMLERLKIRELAGRYPRELSGGQQQRTALARILVNRPEVLLLDEPFSALDSHLRFQLERQLKQITKDFGKPVLLVSHDREEVFRLSRRVAVLYRGAVQALGDCAQVFAKPKTVAAAKQVGCRNFSTVSRDENGVLMASDWGFSLPEEFARCGFVGLMWENGEEQSEGVSLRCTVEDVMENPRSCLVVCKTPKGSSSILTEWHKPCSMPTVGESVQLHIPYRQLLILDEISSERTMDDGSQYSL